MTEVVSLRALHFFVIASEARQSVGAGLVPPQHFSSCLIYQAHRKAAINPTTTLICCPRPHWLNLKHGCSVVSSQSSAAYLSTDKEAES